MKLKYKILLLIDCIVNLFLGILLLLFPIGIIDFLGLPQTNTNFYPSILGAVIFGIGLSLFLELAGHAKHYRGLEALAELFWSIQINCRSCYNIFIYFFSFSPSCTIRLGGMSFFCDFGFTALKIGQ